MASKRQRQAKLARRQHHNAQARQGFFDLTTLNVTQLRGLATNVGLSGVSKLRKNELIGALTPFRIRKEASV